MLPTHSLLIYCGIYVLAIAMPGPGIVSIVARALGSGFRATIPATLGTLLGDLVIMTLSVLGQALAAQVRGLFASVAVRRRMNKGAAVVMIGAGLGVAVS